MRAVTTVKPSVALSDRSSNRFSTTHTQRVRHLQSTGVSRATLRAVCVLPCRPLNTLQHLPRAFFSTQRVAVTFCVYGAATFSLQHRPSFQWEKAGCAATSKRALQLPHLRLACFIPRWCISELRTVALCRAVFCPPPREELNQLLRSAPLFILFSPLRDVASKEAERCFRAEATRTPWHSRRRQFGRLLQQCTRVATCGD